MPQGLGSVEVPVVDSLPPELIRKCLSYLSYDEISKLRPVSKKFEVACASLLNGGFVRVEKYHAACMQRIKEQLPRRESERRKHALSRHADILSALETRINLLTMTFSRYIEFGMCCFIPGKVLDEIIRILRIVESTPSGEELLRPHELLKELRDISSMAMEYFEDRILPSFKTNPNFTAATCRSLMHFQYCATPLALPLSPSLSLLRNSNASSSSSPSSPTNVQHAKDIVEIKTRLRRCEAALAACRSQVKQLQAHEIKQRYQAIAQNRLMLRQARRMATISRRVLEHDIQVGEIMMEVQYGGCSSSSVRRWDTSPIVPVARHHHNHHHIDGGVVNALPPPGERLADITARRKRQSASIVDSLDLETGVKSSKIRKR